MNFWDPCVVITDKALMTRDLIQVTQTFLFPIGRWSSRDTEVKFWRRISIITNKPLILLNKGALKTEQKSVLGVTTTHYSLICPHVSLPTLSCWTGKFNTEENTASKVNISKSNIRTAQKTLD